MKLLDNLEGVTPSTFPKNPIGIVNEIIQQQKCKYDFVYRTETQQPAENTSIFANGPCVDEGCGATGGHTVYHAIARVKGPAGRLVVLSDEKSAGSRRAVRARCSEQVLLRMHWDHAYLQRAIDESKAPVEEGEGGAVEVAGQ